MPEEVDLSEFLALSRKSTCKISSVLGLLPPSKRTKLVAALAEDAGRIPNAVILRWIKDNAPDPGGLMPTTEGISKHRKGNCSCA
jgi:hypothetical protein